MTTYIARYEISDKEGSKEISQIIKARTYTTASDIAKNYRARLEERTAHENNTSIKFLGLTDIVSCETCTGRDCKDYKHSTIRN